MIVFKKALIVVLLILAADLLMVIFVALMGRETKKDTGVMLYIRNPGSKVVTLLVRGTGGWDEKRLVVSAHSVLKTAIEPLTVGLPGVISFKDARTGRSGHRITISWDQNIPARDIRLTFIVAWDEPWKVLGAPPWLAVSYGRQLGPTTSPRW